MLIEMRAFEKMVLRAMSAKSCVVFDARNGTYGAPRIWKDLMDEDIRVGKKRVARLMGEMGIYGFRRRKSTQTTVKRCIR